MSSFDTPDLEELSFYRQLVSNHSDLYQKVQISCSIIVIPQNLSHASLLARDVFESHIFRPSPFFKGKHVSWNELYELEFDANGYIRVVHKKKGVGERLFRIISQEDVRHSQRQHNYSILIVAQPLVDINVVTSVQVNALNKATSNVMLPPVSVER
jgi:hypothetical protein